MVEMKGDYRRAPEKEVDDAKEIKDKNENNTNNIKKERRSSSLARFGCLRMESDETGGVEMEVEFPGERNDPTHLVVMVNGINGSAQNWRFAAKQFLNKYAEDVIVHCSESNYSKLTFDGVDVMGDRLAEEVKHVISRHPSVQKISFVSHSLGGLVARYAIALLYEPVLTRELSQTNGDCRTDHLGGSHPEGKFKGKIAGLEPINFITLASPHLGSRWHKQVPILCGSHALEKIAARISWYLGGTVKHLFLTDRRNEKPPLLLQMVSDCEDLKFMSALQSFKRRVVYANETFDHIVGWSTSSLRRRNELPKIKNIVRSDKYPHIVNVETAKTATIEEVPSEAKINGNEKINMEEEMIRSLTKLSWERVDVNFKGSRQRLLAHSTIQVKNYSVNSDGADVVQHVIDNFLL
ncbi:hypothetical protein REPUB_Repub02eG0067000 [Reevesia pubescens]